MKLEECGLLYGYCKFNEQVIKKTFSCVALPWIYIKPGMTIIYISTALWTDCLVYLQPGSKQTRTANISGFFLHLDFFL